MKFIFTCLFFLVMTPVLAQENRLSQLLEKLNTVTNDSLKADIYIDLHNEVFKTDLNKATEYAQGILKYGQLAGSWKQVETGYLGLARVARKRRNYNTVMPYDFSALEYARKTKNAGEIYNCTVLIARDYMDADMLNKAFPYLRQAENLAATTQRPAYIAKVKQSIGYYYYKQEKHSQAVPYFREAIAAALKVNDDYIQATSRMWMGYSLVQLKQYNGLPEIIFDALAYFTKINSQTSMATCHELLGYCYLSNSDAKQGISNFLEAKRLYEESGNTVEQGLVCPELARCYMLAKDYANAKKYIEEANDIFTKSKYEIGITQLKTLWGQYYSETGQMPLADKYFKEADKLLKNKPQTDLLINNETYWAANLYRENNFHGGDSLTYSYTQRVAGYKEPAVIARELTELKAKNKSLDSISLADLRTLYTKGGAEKIKKKYGAKSLTKVFPFLDTIANISPYSNASAKQDSIQSAKFNIILLDKETQYKTKIKSDSLKLEQQNLSNKTKQLQLTNTILYLAIAASIMLIILLISQIYFRRRAERDKKQIEDLKWELTHRVYNNFNHITDMADKALAQDKSSVPLKTLNGNIKAMSSLYELLNSNIDKNGISMQYALKQISDILKRIYDYDNQIEIIVQSDVKLGGNTAETVARIVTEVITNSFKHAFKKQEKGLINIILSATNSNTYQLTIHDNGCGLPAGPVKNTGGVARLSGIANQIDGKTRFITDNGTLFTLTFPKATT